MFAHTVYFSGLMLFGMVVGVYSAVFGLGGGLLMVPFMIAMGYDIKVAAATSLVIIIPTALAAVVQEVFLDRIDWAVAVVLATGAVIGSMVGVPCRNYLASITLERMLGALMVLIGLNMLRFQAGGVEWTLKGLARLLR